MELQSLVAQLLSGAAGGNVAGAIFRSSSLGTLGNSIVGLIGGVVGGRVLAKWAVSISLAAAASTGVDIGPTLGHLVCGGIGGLVLTTFIGVLRQVVSSAK
jgi:uncharacterized membrane protein YeaQ/YmgE (transglycosylase-associated protein family)